MSNANAKDDLNDDDCGGYYRRFCARHDSVPGLLAP